jgi:hypothetical protein
MDAGWHVNVSGIRYLGIDTSLCSGFSCHNMKAEDDGFALYARLSDTWSTECTGYCGSQGDGRCGATQTHPPVLVPGLFLLCPHEGLGGFHNKSDRVWILKCQEQCPVWTASVTASPESYPSHTVPVCSNEFVLLYSSWSTFGMLLSEKWSTATGHIP